MDLNATLATVAVTILAATLTAALGVPAALHQYRARQSRRRALNIREYLPEAYGPPAPPNAPVRPYRSRVVPAAAWLVEPPVDPDDTQPTKPWVPVDDDARPVLVNYNGRWS